MKDAVILFAKLPEKGKVKTRFAGTLGDDFAYEFYKICAEHAFDVCRNVGSEGISTYFFYDEIKNEENIKKWAGKRFKLFHQQGKDLGERMMNAFKTVFDEGINRAVLIGSDIPDISSLIIKQAIESLDNNSLVIGPAKDGGYYLVGMKRLHEFIFNKINWGTENVFTSTIEKIKLNNLSVFLTGELFDIDTEEKLREWMNQNAPESDNIIRSFVIDKLG